MLTFTLNSLPHLTGRVNLLQLAQVETEFMPAHTVRFAAAQELVRVAQEVAEERPELADEAKYVAETELHRRAVKMSLHA